MLYFILYDPVRVAYEFIGNVEHMCSRSEKLSTVFFSSQIYLFELHTSVVCLLAENIRINVKFNIEIKKGHWTDIFIFRLYTYSRTLCLFLEM